MNIVEGENVAKAYENSIVLYSIFIEYWPDVVIVGFKPGTPSNAIQRTIVESNCSVIQPVDDLYVSVLKVPQGFTVPEMVEWFVKQKTIKFAEPNYYEHQD